MLMFAFIFATFSSVSWLIYALAFINDKLSAEGLWEQNPENLLIYLAILLLPELIIWMIFGHINQFITNSGMNKKQSELLKQLQKNQDYTDLVVRVMLDAEHEIKDGFVINKFDTFIADMNESLGEIIQRCNIASSAQLEQLWQRVRRGERWTLGKAILDASKSQSTFDAWAREKVNRDKVFRGSLLEFCSRYQNLLELLEKHDRDRIFIRIIENGVFGKVYSIIAPLSEGINNSFAPTKEDISAHTGNNDYTSALKLATMEEPKADETIVNVDKNDEAEDDFPPAPKTSFFAHLNPFKKQEIASSDEHDQDPFFQALHNSFKDDEPRIETNDYASPLTVNSAFTANRDEPSLSATKTESFNSLRNTLNTLRQNEQTKEVSFSNEEKSTGASDNTPSFSTGLRAEPSLGSAESSKFSNSAKDEDFVYPFGGWTDEENYRK